MGAEDYDVIEVLLFVFFSNLPFHLFIRSNEMSEEPSSDFFTQAIKARQTQMNEVSTELSRRILSHYDDFCAPCLNHCHCHVVAFFSFSSLSLSHFFPYSHPQLTR